MTNVKVIMLALVAFAITACGEETKDTTKKEIPMVSDQKEEIVGHEGVSIKLPLPNDVSTSCGLLNCAAPLGSITPVYTSGSIENQFAADFTRPVNSTANVVGTLFSKTYSNKRWGYVYTFGMLLGDQPYIYGFTGNANGGAYSPLNKFCQYGRSVPYNWYGFPVLALVGANYTNGTSAVQSYTGSDSGNCNYDTFNDVVRVTFTTCDSSYPGGLAALQTTRRTSFSRLPSPTAPTYGTQPVVNLTTVSGICKTEVFYTIPTNMGMWYRPTVPKLNAPDAGIATVADTFTALVQNPDGTAIAGCGSAIQLANVYDINNSPVGTLATAMQLAYTMSFTKTPPCVVNGPGLPVTGFNLQN